MCRVGCALADQQELVEFPTPRLPEQVQRQLARIASCKAEDDLPPTRNPSLQAHAQVESGEASDHLDADGQANAKSKNVNKRFPILQSASFDELSSINWPAEVKDYNERLTQCMERIKRRHDATVTTVAQGVLEYKRATKNSTIKADVQRFLDRFYMSRIGIRFLIGQHIALGRALMSQPNSSLGRLANAAKRPVRGIVPSHGGEARREEYVGVICTNTNVGSVAHEAIENARFVCEEHYGLFKAPPVQLVCPKDLEFMYVPSHLNHMLFELLKNSLRAVVERYGTENEDAYPPIKVIIVEGKEDITIKISDEGGGIPRSEVPYVWTYMYTTAQSEDLDPDFQSTDFQAPMAGFGYGLPLARLVRAPRLGGRPY